MTQGFDIITFSHLRWDFVFQRPQHLLSRLAATHRVIFIEEPIWDPASDPHWEIMRPEANLLICRPHTPLATGGFTDDQMPVLARLVNELLRPKPFPITSSGSIRRSHCRSPTACRRARSSTTAWTNCPRSKTRPGNCSIAKKSCSSWPMSFLRAAPACIAPRRAATRTRTVSPAASTRSITPRRFPAHNRRPCRSGRYSASAPRILRRHR